MNGQSLRNDGRNGCREVLFLLCRILSALSLALLFFTALRLFPVYSTVLPMSEEARTAAMRRLLLLCLGFSVCVVLLNTEERRLPLLSVPFLLAAGAVPLLGTWAYAELDVAEAPNVFAGAAFLLVPPALGFLLSPAKSARDLRIPFAVSGLLTLLAAVLLSLLPLGGHILLTTAAYHVCAPFFPLLAWGTLLLSLASGIGGKRTSLCLSLLASVLPAFVLLGRFDFTLASVLSAVLLPLFTILTLLAFFLPPILKKRKAKHPALKTLEKFSDNLSE